MELEMHGDVQCHILVQGATTNNCLDGVVEEGMGGCLWVMKWIWIEAHMNIKTG